MDSTIHCNQYPMAINSASIFLPYPFHLYFSQFMLYFVVIKHLHSFGEIGGWFPGHFVVVVAFPFDLLFVAAFVTQHPLMQCNRFYTTQMLHRAILISYSSNRRWRRLFPPVICSGLFVSANVQCIVDQHIRW